VSRIEVNGKKSLKRPKLSTKESLAHGRIGCKGLAGTIEIVRLYKGLETQIKNWISCVQD
jgi:hypothetical protein